VSLRLALAFLFLIGCDAGDSSADGCHADRDCPSGSCVAGVCVMLTYPLDAAVADLTPISD
jgi:hypothetical protein